MAKALEDKEFRVRAQSAHALGQLGVAAKSVSTQLAALTADPHANVRRQAIEALELIAPNDEAVLAKVIQALDESEPQVAVAAIRSLAQHADKALPGAINLLKKSPSKSKARYWACVLVNEFGSQGKDAVGPLAEVLKTDEDPATRMQAALALASIGPDAQPPCRN